MNQQARELIAFDVQTDRILQILSSEIYDSPKAFLRENVQNAYDAILMRCTAQQLSIAERRIDVTVEKARLTVRDDGIGMTDEILRNNFWKAGSSGKTSDLAQRSGVIGTFGIGAMANFGVSTALRVETRHIDSDVTLVSSAKRADLRIAQNCIDLDRLTDNREPGTIVEADLDPSFSVGEPEAREYLRQYVRFLPVPVFLNGQLISQDHFQDALGNKAAGFTEISSRPVSRGEFVGTLRTFVNPQARVLARLDGITLGGNPLSGEVLFVQQGGQTLGFRNLFGLAPIPVSGAYEFGGFVNLNILHPTAGREALSRESIQHVANLVSLMEAEASRDLAETSAADQNQQFQQYILSQGLIQLAKNVALAILPAGDKEVLLGEVAEYEPFKAKHFYSGNDATILRRFASEQANLFHVSQTNPRRKLQLRYLKELSMIPEVPEQTIVDRIPSSQLTLDEAMFLVKLRGVLLDEYFMPDIDAALASISHGVAFHIEKKGDVLHISIARDIPAVRMVVESYKTAREVFHGFVVDFVRQQLYPDIRDHVPSSTRQGRDALYRRLKENEELFRYEQSEFGAIESLLADYLAGKTDLEQVLRSSGGRGAGQRQEVRKEQVGTVEEELPDIIGLPSEAPAVNKYEAAPPILRPNMTSAMKVLTVAAEHSKLNGFRMFLALSDRLAKSEGEFLREPHSTKLMWGSHRVIYVFTGATGDLSLYYDIKLKEPLEAQTTGGTMVPTTTIVTRDRVFVPVPKVLEPAFQITDGAKEFYVRFDTIP
ncbi:MAG: ATP-binding protein [Acidobacteria bacterium]|nr:ATP-binding protein [Acidobacteriota bacterium]